jgi:hypothetical protein
LEFVEAQPSRVEPEDDGVWGREVERYLRSARGRGTPALVAAQLATARHSHLEDEDVAEAVHKTRQQLEAASAAPDATQGHPKIDVPAKRKRG